MDIDLDAAARAREEKVGTNTLTFKGKKFDLPSVGPYAFMETLGALLRQQEAPGGIRVVHMPMFEACLETVLNGQLESFLALNPDFVDVELAVTQLSEMYTGLDRGNSGASDFSSKKTSGSSRRPSKQRTGSTSPTPSGENTPSASEGSAS